jgi:hypothetical protein
VKTNKRNISVTFADEIANQLPLYPKTLPSTEWATVLKAAQVRSRYEMNETKDDARD